MGWSHVKVGVVVATSFFRAGGFVGGHWALGTHVLGVPLEASVVNVTFKVNLVEFCSTLQLYRVFTNPMPCHDDPSFP